MASQHVQYEEIYSLGVMKTITDEFSRLKGSTYLDHTGSTLYAESQIKLIFDDLTRSVYGNPHSFSLSSKYTQDIIELTRYRILSHFHCDPEEYSVVFTSGATNALKLVVEAFDWTGDGEKSHPRRPKIDSDLLNPGNKVDKCSSGMNHGHFVYFNESHTSVIGMREVAAGRGASVDCITHSALKECLSRKESPSESVGNSLFVYPAQCNFSGVKYPLNWVKKIQMGALNSFISGRHSNWYCFLDAATFVSTNELNLSDVKPDFVCISFYKIFGYPTGLGALLVRNSVGHLLHKEYFGGGSVSISLSDKRYHVPRPGFERLEDGTISFLSILSLQHGFNTLHHLVGSMSNVTKHTFNLARYFYLSLVSMHHYNGNKVAEIYCDTNYDDMETQGNIVNFNLLRGNGNYIGYAEVLQMANLHNIHLRTGCFCNPGACQRHLKLTEEQLLENLEAGHVCGDSMDLINGKPTGSVRISFGYMSSKNDADSMLKMIIECFIEKDIPKKEDSASPLNNGEKIEALNNESNKAQIGCYSPNETLHGMTKISMYQDMNTNEECLAGPTISHIFLYPVKSCGAFQVQSWPMGPFGLLHDRQWMVVTSNGVCLTQKRAPTLCMINPVIDLKKGLLILRYPGMQDISLPLRLRNASSRLTSSICQSKVCGSKVEAQDCGDAVAEWLTTALKDPSHGKLHLFCQYFGDEDNTTGGNEVKSDVSGRRKDLSLSNQAQFLLINYSSIQWLAEKINKAGEDGYFTEDELISRFRCNFVIKGPREFSENTWHSVKIGKFNFQSEGPCTRCQIICTNQSTGKKTKEPMMTITRAFDGKVKFGIYLTKTSSPQTINKISVGDLVNYKKES